jgi:hypothetical protein
MQQEAAKLLVPSKLLVIYYQIPPPHWTLGLGGGREWARLIYYNYIINFYSTSY